MKEIVLSVKRQKTEILCLYRARLSDEHYLYHRIWYKLVRALDTIVVDAAHHLWLLRVVGHTSSVVLRSTTIKKMILLFSWKKSG